MPEREQVLAVEEVLLEAARCRPRSRPAAHADACVLLTALRGTARARTVLVVHYDQWGGYFDRRPPAEGDRRERQSSPRSPSRLLPTRVPGPVHRGVAVHHRRRSRGDAFEHTSILRMIEWRWGFPGSGPRPQRPDDLAEAFDFARAGRPSHSVTYGRPPIAGAADRSARPLASARARRGAGGAASPPTTNAGPDAEERERLVGVGAGDDEVHRRKEEQRERGTCDRRQTSRGRRRRERAT